MSCCVVYKPFIVVITGEIQSYRYEYVPSRCYTTYGGYVTECKTIIDDTESYLAMRRLIEEIKYRPSTGSITGYEFKHSVSTECTTTHSPPTTKCVDSFYIPVPYVIPPTTVKSANIGWHTFTTAREPFLPKKRFIVTVANAVHGVFIGLSPHILTKFSLSAFKWGLLFTVSGVSVFEGGKLIKVLSEVYTTNDYVYIEHGGDKIIYGFNNIKRISVNNPKNSSFFVHTSLYDAGDSILCAAYDTIPSVVSTASLSGTSVMYFIHKLNNTIHAAFLLKAKSSLSATPLAVASLYAYTQMILTRGTNVFCTIPALLGLASEGSYSFISVTLPKFVFDIFDVEVAYVPPTPVRVSGFLPSFSLLCLGSTIHLDTGQPTFSPVIMLASEYPYSLVNMALSSFRIYATERKRLYINVHSIVAVFDVYNEYFPSISAFWDTAYGHRSYLRRP